MKLFELPIKTVKGMRFRKLLNNTIMRARCKLFHINKIIKRNKEEIK
jgi:hypothetical protein